MLKPYQKSRIPKKNQIEKMFDKISNDYDLLNWIITFNNHNRWKNNILSIAKKLNPTKALDIATGTADIASESPSTMRSRSFTVRELLLSWCSVAWDNVYCGLSRLPCFGFDGPVGGT